MYGRSSLRFVRSFVRTKISRLVSCSIPGTCARYTLQSVLPLVRRPQLQVILTKNFIEMLIKKMVEYPNDPPVTCTVCQPLSRKRSTRYRANHFLERPLLINLANVSFKQRSPTCGLRSCWRGRTGHTIVLYDFPPDFVCKNSRSATAMLFPVNCYNSHPRMRTS